MKKSQIKALVASAIDPQMLCKVLFKYDLNYQYCFPLITSDKLILSANEDEFILDGFSIRRFCDVIKAEIKNDKYYEIIKMEGVLDTIQIPEVDITDWHSAFLSLANLGFNVIIERESLDEDECEFAIGKIVKVLKSKVIFRDFDADGIWQDELLEIPFSKITSVTFASRYEETFSKYI